MRVYLLSPALAFDKVICSRIESMLVLSRLERDNITIDIMPPFVSSCA